MSRRVRASSGPSRTASLRAGSLRSADATTRLDAVRARPRSRLGVEQMPDVTLPFANIITVYPGASPEAVENDVSRPNEYAVNTVSGVKRIYSNSREAQSQVFVEFRLGTDVTRAIQDARDKIALVRPTFPRDVKDPQVVRVEIEDNRPTVSLAVLSPTVGLRELSSLTDQTVVKAIEKDRKSVV